MEGAGDVVTASRSALGASVSLHGEQGRGGVARRIAPARHIQQGADEPHYDSGARTEPGFPAIGEKECRGVNLEAHPPAWRASTGFPQPLLGRGNSRCYEGARIGLTGRPGERRTGPRAYNGQSVGRPAGDAYAPVDCHGKAEPAFLQHRVFAQEKNIARNREPHGLSPAQDTGGLPRDGRGWCGCRSRAARCAPSRRQGPLPDRGSSPADQHRWSPMRRCRRVSSRRRHG